jgi:hypothetical protein
MAVTEKEGKMIGVLTKLVAAKKDSLHAEDMDKVLSWIQRGTGEAYVSLEEWLESRPNEMALKVVAKWLQDGDTTPFEDEAEAEPVAEPECHSLSEEVVLNGSYDRFSAGDLDMKRLFGGDGIGYIEELANDHAEPIYNRLVSERDGWEAERSKMKAAVRRRPVTTDGEAAFEAEIPEVDIHFIVSSKLKKLGKSICGASSERCKKVMTAGPPSSGKSQWCSWLAATEKRPFFSINCSTVREPQQWFGKDGAKSGSTFWKPSEFVRAIEMGGCIVRLEELNRLSPFIVNPLLELLEDGRTRVEGYGMVEIGPDTIFIATANVGMQYQGTYKSCESLLSRFSVKVEFTPLTEAQTTKTLVARTGVDVEVAKKLATVSQQVYAKTGVVGTGSYDKPITYRQLEAACYLYTAIGNEAFRVSILNHYESDGADSERSRILKLLAGVGLA